MNCPAVRLCGPVRVRLDTTLRPRASAEIVSDVVSVVALINLPVFLLKLAVTVVVVAITFPAESWVVVPLVYVTVIVFCSELTPGAD